jgi:DNA polymerase I-like protein with 3'-5' exonuclease and polymerase domains
MLYGQGVPSMARKLDITGNRADSLVKEHRHRFPRIWEWSKEQLRSAYAAKRSYTRWGWYLSITHRTRKTTLRNFPVQGTGADIMRLAHILLFEAGIRVCAPVHDAFLIECPETEIEETKVKVCQIMARAGRLILGPDSILEADVSGKHVLRHPQRLIETTAEPMWNRIYSAIQRFSSRPAENRSAGRPITLY